MDSSHRRPEHRSGTEAGATGRRRRHSRVDPLSAAMLREVAVDLPPTAAIRENDLRVGQRVVYPNQGVCRISGIEVKEIGGVRAEFLTMKREEDGATVMVPRAKLSSIGLRHVAQPDEIQAILKFLEAESGDPELDWKVRHRTHSDKMTDGSLTGTAEVLKALHSLSERRPLPQKERELYDSARHLVVNEVAVALSVARATGEDIVDFCLTPPAGTPRAQHKAKLKAEREEAEESALLEDLGDLADVASLPEGAELLEGALPEPNGEAGKEDATPEAAASKAPTSKAGKSKAVDGEKRKAGANGQKTALKTSKKTAPKPAPKAAAKSKTAPKPTAAIPPKSDKKKAAAGKKAVAGKRKAK
jgi:CarD family transcriptional regulator